MDKVFKVLLFKAGDRDGKSVSYYLTSIYDVSKLIENITPDTVVQVSVYPVTDITSDNVKDFII